METIKRHFIGSYIEAPGHLQDNEFIKYGYRIEHKTCCQVSSSLFTCHNETVNIWTHLIGSIVMLGFFIGVAVAIIPSRFSVGRDMVDTYSNSQPLMEYIDTKIDYLSIQL